MGVLLDHPLVYQLPSHHHLPVLAMPHPITRQRTLFCFLVHRGIPIQIRVGILFHYPPSMHLVIPTHLFLFWVICHPSRIFPQKSLSGNPRIGFPLLPTAKPYPLLPLTHYPPLLYWLGIGWWCLSHVRAPLLCVSKTCLLLMRLLWPGGLSMLLILDLLWCERVFEPSFFMACFL